MLCTYNFLSSEAPLRIFPSSLLFVRYLEILICTIRKGERWKSLKIKKPLQKTYECHFLIYVIFYYCTSQYPTLHILTFWNTLRKSCADNLKRYLDRYSAKYSVRHLGLVAWAVLSRDVLDSHYLHLLGITVEQEKKVFSTLWWLQYSTLCVEPYNSIGNVKIFFRWER